MGLDRWFQTMRGVGGYGGPISHWWESNFLHCGAMADWRYEGILCGFISLFRLTQDRMWIERAIQAGDDLVAAQLPSGKYRNSSFQQGPMEGGTPHEAASDVGLLELARILREIGNPAWSRYLAVAQRNIELYLLGDLWNGEGFRDMPWSETLVPNKNATIAEALVLYEAVSGQDMSMYLDKAVQVILNAQEKTGPRAGGIVHTGTGRHRIAASIYSARAVCGLLRAYQRDPRDAWLHAGRNALSYLCELLTPQGAYFGRYPNGKLVANPRFIAGAGDLLRAMVLGYEYGLCSILDIQLLAELLVQFQSASGGISTAYGFARRGGTREHRGLAEFRDVLPVVGWCDKAFRALALVSSMMGAKDGVDDWDAFKQEEMQVECTWKRRRCIFTEDAERFQLLEVHTGKTLYRWRKGTTCPDLYLL
jgi:hypothetical protein